MEKPDTFNFAPLVGVALAKPRPLRLKIRSRKKLPHLEAHTLDIAPFEGAQLQMTMRELIDFAPAEHGIIIDGKSLSAQEVDELRPQARTQLESARQWAEEKYGVAPAVPVNYQEGPYYGTIDADLPEFVLRACGEIYEVSGELPAGKRAEFLDARYCKDDPRGAWLSLHGKAGPNGFVLRPNFAYRPAWSVQPSPQQWAADIETFPRTAEWIPDWLVIQLQEAQ
ncbi:TPA: hypothetical protein I8V91_000539 [Corynebacterium striatum]|uniref:hypothetical protein n=1 Tax=Corynebacterium striatum TaxID=43770 RepID=UPI001A1904DF|nr:hypothetical protein [Corynebacterium striatum]HAT1249796.1 hypothetical protein [Corynebacterium striatum]HAT1252794.1 hypothetical protein [Corynebacterium striatum]HAT1266058.1 hypothetical protein [Corynebacterium striatum]HAT1294718.1 hypothetical protein [Corynebacterium striatum]